MAMGREPVHTKRVVERSALGGLSITLRWEVRIQMEKRATSHTRFCAYWGCGPLEKARRRLKGV